ncbi:WXG100 family type VII secretion target [Nocardia carnea]|uniref:WXG100 family type VII secretion target n=1 Tax=Nocardia carnea TaxID=37328 RepID=UPI00245509B2|nr:WXG100 family type VII secretion target [Nocardia carnea]
MGVAALVEGELSVVPEDVRNIGRIAYRIATELRSGASTLDLDVTTLLSSWTGTAADSYRAAWAEMHDSSEVVWNELFEPAEKLGITADNYVQTDGSTAAAVSSLNL